MAGLQISQVEPKSKECAQQLLFLRMYFAGWVVWFFILFYKFGVLKFDSITMGLLLLYGMMQLNDQFLAVFAFLNVLPFVTNVTTFLDYVFKGFKSSSKTSIPMSIWIFRIFDSVVVLIGIKIAYECFKVFRAERLGFPMEGEIDIKASLNDEEEFSGKGVKVGGSETQDSDSD